MTLPLLTAAMILAEWLLLRHSPDGWQDADGFHCLRKCSGCWCLFCKWMKLL